MVERKKGADREDGQSRRSSHVSTGQTLQKRFRSSNESGKRHEINNGKTQRKTSQKYYMITKTKTRPPIERMSMQRDNNYRGGKEVGKGKNRKRRKRERRKWERKAKTVTEVKKIDRQMRGR